VVVTQAVQQAVQEEELHFPLERLAPLGGLARRRRHRDHDVAEVLPLRRGFAREGEDVGRLVLLPEVAVESLHRAVAGEPDAEAVVIGGDFGDERDQPGAQLAAPELRVAGGAGERDVERQVAPPSLRFVQRS
jgi:hypothetical protein